MGRRRINAEALIFQMKMYYCFLSPSLSLSFSLLPALFSCLPPEPESWLCLAEGEIDPRPLPPLPSQPGLMTGSGASARGQSY